MNDIGGKERNETLSKVRNKTRRSTVATCDTMSGVGYEGARMSVWTRPYSPVRQDCSHLQDTLRPVADLVVSAQPVDPATQQVAANSDTPTLAVRVGVPGGNMTT